MVYAVVMTKATAKIFMHGRSQAVRLPKEYRMPGKEVEISRVGDSVVIKPITEGKVDWEKYFAEMKALGSWDEFEFDRDIGLLPPREKFD
jgi:antitoxin VapB